MAQRSFDKSIQRGVVILLSLAACGPSGENLPPKGSTFSSASAPIPPAPTVPTEPTRASGPEPSGATAPLPPPPGPSNAAIRVPSAPATDVKRGDRGLDVVRLQLWLKLASANQGGAVGLDEDGIFGGKTSTMLRDVQQRAGLEPTAILDVTTHATLQQEVTSFARNAWSDYPNLPATFTTASGEALLDAYLSAPVIPGEGDRTAYYAPLDRTGFAFGDGAESVGIYQGSTAHVGWVADDLLSPSEVAVIGVISRNEGPFVAVNSYDNGYYTWGAYQLIGAYRIYAYQPRSDELGAGLAYQKRLDPPSFWFRFQRFGIDVTATFTDDGVLNDNSVDVSLALPDGSTLRGLAMWERVGTDPQLNQIFINAGKDPRIQRTHVMSAKLTHFDVLDQPLKTGWARVRDYFTSELLVAAFLDMELNMGRGAAKREFSEAIEAIVVQYPNAVATDPSTWSARDEMELAVLEYTLAHPPSVRYGERAARLAQTVLLSSAAHSYQ